MLAKPVPNIIQTVLYAIAAATYFLMSILAVKSLFPDKALIRTPAGEITIINIASIMSLPYGMAAVEFVMPVIHMHIPAKRLHKAHFHTNGGFIMDKIIFLDIDGVLNSSFWNEAHQKEISDGTLIDTEKIALLAQLAKRANAKIILHSGWRFWFDNNGIPLRRESERLAKLLSDVGLRISGMTPDLTTEEIRKTKKFSLVKADEILLWLDRHPDVSGWVVLDDLPLHNETITRHQVLPNQDLGLTLDDIAKAERILNADRATFKHENTSLTDTLSF